MNPTLGVKVKMPAFLQLVPNTEHSNHILRTRWSYPLAHFIYCYLALKKSSLLSRYIPVLTLSHLLTEKDEVISLEFTIQFRDSLSQHAAETLTARCYMTFAKKRVCIKLVEMAKPLAKYLQNV